MNKTLVAAALAAAVLLPGLPALAQTPASTGPVRLDNVEIERSYGIEHQLYPGIVAVDFTNTAPVAIKQVDFALERADGTFIREYHDVGSVQRRRELEAHVPRHPHRGKIRSSVVDTVTFADGTQWSVARYVGRRSRRCPCAICSSKRGAGWLSRAKLGIDGGNLNASRPLTKREFRERCGLIEVENPARVAAQNLGLIFFRESDIAEEA